ncbi:YbaY family lipoprotein [Ferrimonas lipolytica]|uniref:Lipoprotein n=1 Tax=Ferrimonas lipolytica TaxID=2724191 RepID=A0A6H1UCW1_9GAMM|nr:YbaY family lipoprotein [Ferrimonas lipolytica]QIZ75642.1 hypothetical protein HER31_01230 [Ferrimonas lipolytica]
MLRPLVVALSLLLLSGCISDAPDIEEVEYTQVTGAVTFKEATLLPPNSRLKIAVLDAKERGAILMRNEFNVGKLPVPFFLSAPTEIVNEDGDYAIWAAIEVNGKTLLQTQAPFTRVINNDVFNAIIEVKPLK